MTVDVRMSLWKQVLPATDFPETMQQCWRAFGEISPLQYCTSNFLAPTDSQSLLPSTPFFQPCE